MREGRALYPCRWYRYGRPVHFLIAADLNVYTHVQRARYVRRLPDPRLP